MASAGSTAQQALPSHVQQPRISHLQPSNAHPAQSTSLQSPAMIRPQTLQNPVPSPTSSSAAPSPSSGVSQPSTVAPSQTPQPTVPQQSPARLSASSSASGVALSYKREPMTLASVLLATALFIVTSWVARATFSSTSSIRTSRIFKHVFHVGIGDTLTILAILSSVMTLAMSIVLDLVLESIQWSLIGRSHGASVLSILALSPTTGVSGTAGILISSSHCVLDRCWALGKLLLQIAIWAGGFVLLVNTSLETVYDSVFSYPVWAGIGQFDGSYVNSYVRKYHTQNPDYNSTVIPYTALAPAYNLITNPLHSITSENIDCANDECEAYLLTGGLALTRPWQPTNYTDDPVILIESIPGTQIEFRPGIQQGDYIEDTDCDLFYEEQSLIAILFCMAPSRVVPGSYVAGVYVCNNGTSDGVCSSEPFKPNLTTTFAVYSRNSDIVVARKNYSILSTAKVTTGVPNTALDLREYRSALRWLLNFTAAGVPGTSSIAEYFWSAPLQLTSDYWSPGPRKALQSVVAYPLWLFNVNNDGNIDIWDDDPSYKLPLQFRVKAAIASPRTRIVVNRSMFIMFVILECLVLISAWATVITLWSSDVRLPKISAYPLIDFAFKTKHLTPAEPVSTRDVFGMTASKADSKSVRNKVNHMRVSFRTEIQRAMPIGQTFRRRAKHSSNIKLTSTITP